MSGECDKCGEHCLECSCEMADWTKKLSKEENTEEFSELVHNYYKLATMRVMQVIRKKYNVPKEDIPVLTISIFGRMLNESCYSVGAQFKNGLGIENIYPKKHLLLLLRVLNGEPLNQEDRDDIDTNIQSSLKKFQKFIMENASDFYI